MASPLLANITLDHLDWRLHEAGYRYVRYADDFVGCFQYQRDAERFLRVLDPRLQMFALSLAAEKTRLVAFGPFARRNARRRGAKPEEFTFLGFAHYCGATRHGYFKVKRRTSRKKFQASLRRFTEWVRLHRHRLRTSELIRRAAARVSGHLTYYAVTDNLRRCETYVHWAERILRHWLNRRSQRRSYTWEAFRQALASLGWPSVCIRHDLNPYG